MKQTHASKQAFIDTENASKRISLKKRIVKASRRLNRFTGREMAKHLGERYVAVSKRISDLKKDGKLIVGGEKMESGNMSSIYYYNYGHKEQQPTKTELLFRLIQEHAPEAYQVIYYEFISRK